MSTSIDNLLTQYDTGKLSRRGLLAAIALIAVPRPARAQSSLFRARSLSHVNIGVSDLAASEAFYRKLLGSPPNRPIVGDAFALDFAESGFISLCPQPGGSCSVAGPSAQPGRIDHFGVGIDDFARDFHFARRIRTFIHCRGTTPLYVKTLLQAAWMIS